MQQQIVRHYTGTRSGIERQFTRDSRGLEKQGYAIASQSLIPGKRGGCGTATGCLFLGIPFLLFRPRDTLVVTYHRI